MESAPASIPATTLVAFAAGFGDGTISCAPSRSCRPADSASRSAGGASPAAPTRLGSSNTDRIE